ncbi:MAG: YidC/Oxa1 family membrane protein insertase [Ruminococcaceae bacterium]|nr:YidC/Oxa1 family membrane protein insertase [Oscillospiraceae bacterium]
MYFLAGPLSFIIRPIYNLVSNYGLTLIIVTILIKVATIPLTLKSQKNMAKTQMIQPEINKIQERYKNDRNLLAIEMQKVYKRYNVKPMAGCLPLIIQMFVLFGFIGVIYHPFEYILQMSGKEIGDLAEALGASRKSQETSLWGLNGVNEYIRSIGKTPINFNFFGIDLTKIPSADMYNWTVWIFPVLATLFTYLSGVQTQMQQKQNAGTNSNAPAPGSMMMKIMPIMTGIFTITMPIGMSLYWFVSTFFQIVQQFIMNKFVNDKIKAQVLLTMEEIKEEKAKKKKGKK